MAGRNDVQDWSIALNRFGLGRRLDEHLPKDPERWLLGQIAEYQTRPAPIARAEDSGQIVSEMTRLRKARIDEIRKANAARKSGDMSMADTNSDSPKLKSSKEKGVNPVASQALLDIRRTGRMRYFGDVEASIETALSSDTPFLERLVHFWSNHFAVSVDRNRDVMALAGSLEFEAIRPNMLGNFADMTAAVEQHPAMLLYLDQVQSVGPNSPFMARRARTGRGLNENLAREILELHTLGVRSGYSQADVIELAKALTGWSYGGLVRRGQDRLAPDSSPGQFVFIEALHEPGERTFMGKRYTQQGAEQAAAMIDDVSRAPQTALHIATKLARHFASDDPPKALVDRLRDAFMDTGGDLPTLYRTLVQSPECWRTDTVKLRTPWDWLVASLRAIGREDIPARGISNLLDQLGQPLWSPGSPAGYDDTAAAWLSADTLIRRVGLASQLAGTLRRQIDPRTLGPTLFPGAFDAETARLVAKAGDETLGLAVLLSSPQMLRR